MLRTSNSWGLYSHGKAILGSNEARGGKASWWVGWIQEWRAPLSEASSVQTLKSLRVQGEVKERSGTWDLGHQEKLQLWGGGRWGAVHLSQPCGREEGRWSGSHTVVRLPPARVRAFSQTHRGSLSPPDQSLKLLGTSEASHHLALTCLPSLSPPNMDFERNTDWS